MSNASECQEITLALPSLTRFLSVMNSGIICAFAEGEWKTLPHQIYTNIETNTATVTDSTYVWSSWVEIKEKVWRAAGSYDQFH